MMASPSAFLFRTFSVLPTATTVTVPAVELKKIRPSAATGDA